MRLAPCAVDVLDLCLVLGTSRGFPLRATSPDLFMLQAFSLTPIRRVVTLPTTASKTMVMDY